MLEIFNILNCFVDPVEDIQDLENDIKSDLQDCVESCQEVDSLENLIQDIANQEETIERK